MDPFICLQIQVPVRREPSHRSEQVSQLLFGERALLLEEKGAWIKIEMSFDGYKGWVERESLDAARDTKAREIKIISSPVMAAAIDHQPCYLPAGAEIPLPDESGNFTLEGHIVHIPDALPEVPASRTEIALKFLHAPYLWGGRTLFGIDCSGLVQLIYKITGVNLPRDAGEQVSRGKEIESLAAVQEDDLLFFMQEEEKITHVGMYLGNGQVIHASKQVRIDRVDEKGIYHETLKRYTHTLHSIRRIV